MVSPLPKKAPGAFCDANRFGWPSHAATTGMILLFSPQEPFLLYIDGNLRPEDAELSRPVARVRLNSVCGRKRR